jgi:hypothetical protein
VVGGTYYVGQYVLNKITEARQRSQLDKIAKDKYEGCALGGTQTANNC